MQFSDLATELDQFALGKSLTVLGLALLLSGLVFLLPTPQKPPQDNEP
jgi:hypothetical protein